MTKSTMLILFFSFLCLNPGNSSSARNDAADFNPPDPGDMKTAVEAATDMVQTHMNLLNIPGIQIAVSSHNKLIWSGSFGYADIKTKTPVTSNTIFRIGSLSKSLTGAGLGLLLQQKKVYLDAPVSRYVPSFPKKRWPVTVGQLAYNTSGIRHYKSTEEASSNINYRSVTESLQQFAGDSLLFQPGTQFSYSSFSYVLLSAVMESAGKQDFPSFMREKVFKPLGMKNTNMDYADSTIPLKSRFYTLDDNDNRIEAPAVNNSSKWAAGGMLSTAEDLVQFGNSLLNETILTPAIRNLLFTQGKTTDGKGTGVGIGWEIMKDEAGREVIVNDGQLPGSRGVLLIYPEEKLVLSVLINTGTSVLFNRQEAQMLAELFLNPAGLTPSVQEIKSAAGRYTYNTLFDGESVTGQITISEKNGKLTGTMTIPNSFFKKRIIRVPVVKATKNRISLLGTPGNWIKMTFENTSKKIQGRWWFGPLKGELTGVQQ